MARAKRVKVKRRESVGFVKMQASGITINGVEIPDVDVETNIYAGESVSDAIERAKREQQAANPKPLGPSWEELAAKNRRQAKRAGAKP